MNDNFVHKYLTLILKSSILPRHCWIQLEGGVAHLHPAPGSLCLVNAAPIEEPVRLSQGCVIVLGKTNMFRYNDPLEAADLRKSMTEKCRKTSLLNQSLLSQSLSDLRNPNGSKRHSAEFRMFASDSDIKDIQEGSEGSSGEGPSSMLGAATASQESVTTLKNPNNSGSSTVQTTPRKAGEEEDEGENGQEDLIKNSVDVSTPSKNLTDINANPHLVSTDYFVNCMHQSWIKDESNDSFSTAIIKFKGTTLHPLQPPVHLLTSHP